MEKEKTNQNVRLKEETKKNQIATMKKNSKKKHFLPFLLFNIKSLSDLAGVH
jgi:hypothetical protein